MPSQPGSAFAFRASVAVLAVSVLALAGAFFFEYVLRLPPCPLCLIQRWPFYAAIPVALAAAALSRSGGGRTGTARVLLGALALAFIAGAGVAAYHAGIEWKFWAGPDSCSGAFSVAADADAFLQRLQTVQVVRCDEAAWRFVGLSLAGWNVPLSLGLALTAAWGALRRV
ncbi:MAG: disulfide bond formation protein B [Pseudochelatococcus sp.]|uniref:disulfide bond formation protein B n=1 Tax=Pseudochelatococcus sp. TaxID=2020869 RepID=UPI003D8F9F74